MSIQFVLGPAGSGKSTTIINKVIQASLEEPDRMFFLIVPEQFTMEAQRDIVSNHPNVGTMNIDAIGFNRLAYRIFDELGLSVGQVLFDFGKSMLIKRILCKNREKLQVYQGCIDKMGFIDEMKSMMSELFQYGIHKTDIETIMCNLDQESIVYKKLVDMQLIYEEFETFMGESYIVAEQLSEMLTEHVADSNILKNSYLYFDGFTGFTPIQMKLICALMKHTKGMTFAFTLGYQDRSFVNIKEHELFYLAKTTIKALADMATEEHIEILDNLDLDLDQEVPCRFEKNAELACLERNLFRFPYTTFGNDSTNKNDESLHNIRMIEADTIQDELRFVAETIRMLVKKKGYRYKDIAIVAGDLEESSLDFKEIMEEFQIPVFIDANVMLKGNPCSETIRSLVAMYSDDFSYDSVFRFLKAGMTDIDHDHIEYLENYALKRGLRKYTAWIREIPETHEQNPEISLEETRKKFIGLLVDISKVFREKTSTVRDYITALYQFMLDIHMYEKLQTKQKELCDRMLFDEGSAYGQIFSKIILLFDKIIELLGDEHMDLKEFYEILDTGLSDIEIGTVPPTIDRVLIGDITRSRLNHVKVLFLTGVNDGIIPKTSKKGKILTDHDREILASQGMELAPSDKINAYIEQFYLYTNITKPSDLLFLSYRKIDRSLKTCRPAYILNRIRNIFPNLQIEEYLSDIHLDTVEGVLRYLVANHDREDKQNTWHTLTTLLTEQGYQKELQAVMGGLCYTNQVHPIDMDTVKLLYGTELIQSVSRLETFAKCNFAYFLRYGLGLKEREVYQIDVRNIGNILHQVMETVFLEVRDTCNNNWQDLSEELRDEMVSGAIEKAASENMETFFEDYERNQYMYTMLKRIAKRTVKTLHHHLKLGTMRPGMIEKSFHTKKEQIDEFIFMLDSGIEMSLRGKIDRVDVEEDGDSVYMKVIDYKSSTKDLKLDQILSGLQLQLCTYSAIAYELEKKMYPDKDIQMAGLLYYGFDDPVVELADAEFFVEDGQIRIESTDKLENERLEHLKMHGFVNAGTEVMQKMDQTFVSSLPVKKDAKGNLKDSENILTKEEITELLDVTKENIRNLGNQIVNGKIDIHPVKDGTSTACDYCDFKAICRFDVKAGNNSYKKTGILESEQEQEERGE